MNTTYRVQVPIVVTSTYSKYISAKSAAEAVAAVQAQARAGLLVWSDEGDVDSEEIDWTEAHAQAIS